MKPNRGSCEESPELFASLNKFHGIDLPPPGKPQSKGSVGRFNIERSPVENRSESCAELTPYQALWHYEFGRENICLQFKVRSTSRLPLTAADWAVTVQQFTRVQDDVGDLVCSGEPRDIGACVRKHDHSPTWSIKETSKRKARRGTDFLNVLNRKESRGFKFEPKDLLNDQFWCVTDELENVEAVDGLVIPNRPCLFQRCARLFADLGNTCRVKHALVKAYNR